MIRCVNIDWLEVYCLEANDRFPCNAEYFRNRGYFVREREYGTRQYNEMFVIEDKFGEPWIEIRRNPASGDSSFNGLVPQSTHIRLANRTCYYDDAVTQLRDFLALHDYIFKRIYRIDVCYDFERFDSGDNPAAFARRYLAGKYSKINQCHVSAHGADNWSAFDWETLSWGSNKSMVTTKLYNKSRELAFASNNKPYIIYSWFEAGLISDPISLTKHDPKRGNYQPEIWRLEFSLRSSADSWIVIEDQSGKRAKKKAIPHTLSLFDSRDKLWQRFQDLAFHYFRFKYFEEGVRKDRCKDKQLFRWNDSTEFYQVQTLPPARKPDNDEEILRRRLSMYRMVHADEKIRQACDVILDEISKQELRRVSPSADPLDVRALQLAIQQRMNCKEEDVIVTLNRIKDLLKNNKIF